MSTFGSERGRLHHRGTHRIFHLHAGVGSQRWPRRWWEQNLGAKQPKARVRLVDHRINQ
jgi:hypothetical protein